MSMDEKDEVEQLKKQVSVKTALKQTAGTQERASKPAVLLRDKLWFGTCALLLLGLAIVFYLLAQASLPLAARYVPGVQRLLVGVMLSVFVVALSKGIQVYGISQIDDLPARHNLMRVLKLVMTLSILIIGLSLLSTTWYTALVSLGIFSLILGFALQTPITSFIGWIYLLARQPYRVGDRIRIGEARGDVIDVGYFDTTLWEYGGPYLSTEGPSGQIIKFPNSQVLSETVYNLSWPLFPFIWNEIRFQVAYDCDLEFVSRTMQEAVEEELGKRLREQVQAYRRLLKQTPVNEVDIQEGAVVQFRASENTWLEAIVRYLVEPKEAGQVKARLTRKLLERLNAEPERAKFPKSNLR